MAEKKTMRHIQYSDTLLGFEEVIQLLSRYFNTEESLDFFHRHRPVFDTKQVILLQNQVKEYFLRTQLKVYPNYAFSYRINNIFAEATKRNMRIDELGKISIILRILRSHANWLLDTQSMMSNSNMTAYFSPKKILLLSKIIDQCTQYFNERGELDTSQIPDLKIIQDKQANAKKKRFDIAKNFINNNGSICTSQSPTIRDGRLVIPVQVSFKSSVEGIIHGMSASSQTVYLEIKDLYEGNNNIELLGLEEEKILYDFAEMLKNELMEYHTLILECYADFIEFDVVKAQHEFANSYSGIFPCILSSETTARDISQHKQEVQNEYEIYLKHARHPLITHCSPIHIISMKHAPQVILTGPNAGGKTVVLKTLGLLALLNQSGIAIPVEEGSLLPIFDNISVVIGDHQNLDDGESTFSAHIKEVKDAIAYASQSNREGIDEKYLLLFDELCSGTDEQEGGALAWAILEYLAKIARCVVFVTSHSSLVKQYAITRMHAEIAALAQDGKNPYTILYGSAGKSEAMSVVKKIGFDEDIIRIQKTIIEEYGSDTQELLDKLHRLTLSAQEKKDFSVQLARENTYQKKDLLAWERYLKDKEIALKKTHHNKLQQKLKEIQKQYETLQKKEKILDQNIAWYEAHNEIHAQIEAKPHEVLDQQSKKVQTNSEQNISTSQKNNTHKKPKKYYMLNGEKEKDFTSHLSSYIDNMAKNIEEETTAFVQKLDEIKEGDEVQVLSTGVRGVVTKILKKESESPRYEIRVGIITLILHRNELRTHTDFSESRYIERENTSKFLVNAATHSSATHTNLVIEHTAGRRVKILELDLRGKYIHEAESMLEIHLNDAVLAQIYSFSIIHGKGNGTLAKGIHKILRNHTLVKKFYFAKPEDGGAGKTIVELL